MCKNPFYHLATPRLIEVKLTDAAAVAEVLLRLNVGLQLGAFVTNIYPLIFHYLLMARQRKRVLLKKIKPPPSTPLQSIKMQPIIWFL